MGKFSAHSLALLKSFAPSEQDLRPTSNRSLLEKAKLFTHIGKVVWENMEPTNDPKKYFEGCHIERSNGSYVYPSDLLDILIKGPSHAKRQKIPECVFTPLEDGKYLVKFPGGPEEWNLETRISLSEAEMKSVGKCIWLYCSTGAHVSLQADAHSAGTIWVGWTSTFGPESIPINLISGDIGCGMMVLPVADKNGNHLPLFTGEERTIFSTHMMLCARKMLKRGRVAEKIDQYGTVSPFVIEALNFYQSHEELGEFLDLGINVLGKIGVVAPEVSPNRCSELREKTFLDQKQIEMLLYISQFGQTLGSSGNHFLELTADENDSMWLVVHSGSRALGAMLYEAMRGVAVFLTGESEMAIGELAKYYTSVYDFLNMFARLNRALCGVAVLKKMGLEWDGEKLAQIMMENVLFSQNRSSAIDESVRGLLEGLTHNGIKAFVNVSESKLIYVLSKGAVAVSDYAACVIVALKAGEGNYLFTLVNRDSPWIEISMVEALELEQNKEWNIILDLDESNGHIILAGHGAGRTQSATATWNQFGYADLVKYFMDRDIVANVGPNTLGDHPDGYKPVSEVVPLLPLDISQSKSHLVTLMSYKEGIDYRPAWRQKCTDYFTTISKKYSSHVREGLDKETVEFLMCDFTLVLDGDNFKKDITLQKEIAGEVKTAYKGLWMMQKFHITE